MNYLDLFSGIGGFRLGAEWDGLKFENEFHSDIDKYANKVYAKHFSESIPLGDITKIKAEDLLKYGNKWIITGGFPCQDISIAGKGAGITGERSGLWFEYWRLIRDLRPRFVIVENVGELVRRGLREVLGSLAEIGYNAEWQDIRAKDMGAPHRRERIWIVAYPIDNTDRTNGTKGREKKSIQGQGKHRPSRCAGMSSRAGKKISNSVCQGLSKSTCAKLDRVQESVESIQGSEFSGAFAEIGGTWETEPELGRLANGIPNRVDRLKCLGNSIVPQIAYLLFEIIKNNTNFMENK